MIRTRLPGIAVLGALTLVLTACVGEQQAVTGVDTLRIATLGATTASEQAFLDRMDELSEGSIDVEVTENWTGSGEDSDEIALTKAVLAGDVDIAWVTVRSLAAIGVEDIDALEMPLLVRTHDQQRAVALGVPGELITRAVNRTGVEALALLPGPQLYPVAADAPLLAAADWTGKTVQVGASSPAEAAAVEALGATASTDGAAGVRDVAAGSVQAAAASPADLLEAGTVAPVFTSNVPLWPRMSVVIINRDVLDRLSSRQNGFLAGSVTRAQDVLMAAPDLLAGAAAACALGARFGTVTGDQLEALASAVAPVREQLEKDAGEKRLLEAIDDVVKRNAGSGATPYGAECVYTPPAV